MTEHEGVDKKEFSLPDFRKGSPDAFRIFFLQSYADFFSFATLLLRDRGSAKNVTSAAFFLLWAKHADFDSEKNIKAFLYSSIRDNGLSYLRHLQEGSSQGSQAPYPGSGTKGYAPDTRFTGSLPEKVLQEVLAYAELFGALK
jgi:DNA-directed RNA polymerase specialized sigma24 family protein